MRVNNAEVMLSSSYWMKCPTKYNKESRKNKNDNLGWKFVNIDEDFELMNNKHYHEYLIGEDSNSAGVNLRRSSISFMMFNILLICLRFV